ncbi:MAG: hypothetical protein OEV74_07750 [Cyclobacteriaceae bacterium]|nr:hypothetical protein [Cyclobacteriaceae bacterium]MDH4296153.1 hypothetical protein [Cyclobacteriaceae bacterium]MDH5249746.1 hypothetical protein [Cyclobacteriaceae bacterium]
MKKQTGIWIDSAKAFIVTFADGTHDFTEVESGIENRIHHQGEGEKGSFFGSQHINNEKTLDAKKMAQVDLFLQKVLDYVKDVDELFVFGPAEVKNLLQQKIESGKTIDRGADKLKSVLVADAMTKNQIVAMVKDFYKL